MVRLTSGPPSRQDWAETHTPDDRRGFIVAGPARYEDLEGEGYNCLDVFRRNGTPYVCVAPKHPERAEHEHRWMRSRNG